MKPLITILLLAFSISAQSIKYDRFSDTRYFYGKTVQVYRNAGGLLVYNPASVRLQVITSSKSDPILLLTVDSFDWQFTQNCNVSFLADGEHYELPCKVDKYHAYTLRHRTYVSEYLSIRSPELLKILNAGRVEMRVGSYEFEVKEKDLKDLRLGIPPK